MVGAEGKNWKIVTLDYQKQTSEELKMSLKDSSTITDILDISHDVVLKLHENRKQT